MTIKRAREYPTKQPLESTDDYVKRLRDAIQEESTDRIQDFDILQLGNVPWVDVRQYGAKGDGTTDDTVAIQAALDTGGIIVFSPGKTYLITELTVDVESTEVHLNSSTLKLNDESADGANMIDLQADHTKVFGGIFDGNKDNQTYKSIAVYIGADDCVVDGIHSIDSKGYGIKGVSVANSDVRNNYIENCDYIGIYFSMTGAAADIDGPRIFNNIVDRRDSTTAEGGIKIHSGTYYYNNVLISGNKVMLGVAGVECIELRAKYSSIVGNYVEGVVTSGIGVTTGSSNVSVTGNTVSCEDTTSYGIELSASTSDIVVNGNCINGAERGIATTGAVDSMERFTISSNTIKGFDTDGIWVRYVDGVTIGDNTIDATAGGRPILISLTTGSVAISGNTLIADLEVDQKGITLDNASSVAITGNTFFGCYRGVKLQSSEVYEFTGIAIVGNDFSNCTDPIIEDVPSGSFSDIKVYGNTGLEDFIDWVNGVEIKTYDGDPTGWLTTSIGSLIIDYTNGDLYISTDGTSTGLREITREAD